MIEYKERIHVKAILYDGSVEQQEKYFDKESLEKFNPDPNTFYIVENHPSILGRTKPDGSPLYCLVNKEAFEERYEKV